MDKEHLDSLPERHDAIDSGSQSNSQSDSETSSVHIDARPSILEKLRSERSILKDHLRQCYKSPNVPEHLPAAGEQIHVLSRGLRQALQSMFENVDELRYYLPEKFDRGARLCAPYVFHYHFKAQVQQNPHVQATKDLEEWKLLCEYLAAQTAPIEREADSLFDAGIITPEYMDYLFAPGQTLLQQDKGSATAVKQISRLEYESVHSQWSCRCRIIEFDDQFKSREGKVRFQYPTTGVSPVKIRELPVFPLRFACSQDRAQLFDRGRFFYDCRRGLYATGPEHDTEKEVRVGIRLVGATKAIIFS